LLTVAREIQGLAEHQVFQGGLVHRAFQVYLVRKENPLGQALDLKASR
jgi:hypothetical protein